MAFDLDEKYINEAEQELGAVLPVNYKKILKENNGGDVFLDEDNFQLYPIFDKSTKKRISRTCNHVISEKKRNDKRSSFPENSIGIASNACGDLLIFKKEYDKYLDEIYLWSHETGELLEVASDFSELKIE